MVESSSMMRGDCVVELVEPRMMCRLLCGQAFTEVRRVTEGGRGIGGHDCWCGVAVRSGDVAPNVAIFAVARSVTITSRRT